MYIHAYQSYVWNAIVSDRIRLYGPDHPIPGDLVFEAQSENTDGNVEMEVDGEVIENEPGTCSVYFKGRLLIYLLS